MNEGNFIIFPKKHSPESLQESEELEQEFRTNAERRRKEARPLPEEMELFIPDLRSFYQDHYSNLGVEIDLDKCMPEFLNLPGRVGDTDTLAITFSKGHQVGMYFDNIRQLTPPEVILVEQALLAVHEGGHSLALRKFQKNQEERWQLVRQGARYIHLSADATHGQASAIEEGRVVLMQFKALHTVISGRYPDQYREYDRLVQASAKRLAVPIESATFALMDGEICDATQYPNSVALTKFLSAEIPDFERLMENFCLHDQALPLARAIGRRFKGTSYEKIMTVTETDAARLLQEIQA